MDGFLERFVTAGESGAALNTSTTPTSIIPAARKITLPSNFFNRVGKELKVRAAGRISNIVTTPGTLTLELRIGSVVAFSSGAMALNIVAKTNVGWILDLVLSCEAIGAGTSTQLRGQGLFFSESVIGAAAASAGGQAPHVLPYNTAPALGTGFDGTAAQTLDLFAAWSVSNASNNIQVHQFSVDSPT